MQQWIIVGMLIILVSNCWAVTNYVSVTGNDSNPGTEDRAWRTLAKVHDTVKSGDVVYFRGGVWTNEYLWPGKTVGITNSQFLAYPGERPIFTGKVIGTSQVRALHLNGPNRNLLFRGLTWSNNWCVATMINQQGHVFEDCAFGWMETGTNKLPGGYNYNCVALWSSRYITFTNCSFMYWGDSTSGDDHGCPLAIGSLATDDMYSTNCFGNVVTDCRFTGGGHDLIEIYSPKNVIRRCKLFNPPFMTGPDGQYYGNRHVSTMTWCAEPNLVEENDFGYSSRPVDTPNTLACFDVSASRLILRRNRAFDNYGVFVSFYAKGYNATPSQNYVYHNSILWVGTSVIAETNKYWWYNRAINWCHDSCTNNRVVNNAIWRVGPSGTNMAFGGWPSMNTSIFAGNLTNNVNPLFADPRTSAANLTTPNLRLLAGSPAIGTGAWLAKVTSADGTGNQFTVDDAGYFYDGWGIPGEVGDMIQLEGTISPTRIVSVNYRDNTVTVDRTLSWTRGQGVALPYNGSAPDVGAYEYGIERNLVSPLSAFQ
jgi:hypothetical protein